MSCTKKKLGCTLRRHAELVSASSRFIGGFTLIEVLVVVLIIAVLTAVAVPMYKKAVLKSRFTTVMPMAKAVADAQEVYYLGNDQYALSKADLDVTPMNVENTEVELSTAAEEENYNYVVAKRTDYPSARYIIYQKHSPKFAGNIHCEAADAEAEWLCEKGLDGVLIEGSVGNNDAKTYVLEGDSGVNVYFPQACEGSGEQTCPCGGPIEGTCDDKEGTWVFEGSCPQPLPALEPQACDAGQIGKKVSTSVCNDAGTAYEYKWDDSGCKANTWYNRSMDYGQAVKEAQEVYYAQHNGQYATSLDQLDLSELQCPEGAVQCRISGNWIQVYYGSPLRPNESTYSIETNFTTGKILCWGSNYSGYGGVPTQRCQELGWDQLNSEVWINPDSVS